MKCAVIGGCGFLGNHLVTQLIKNGHSVKVIDVVRRDPLPTPSEFIKADLCNLQDLLSAFKDVDTVFHCASPLATRANRALFYRVNVEGTKVVIQACRQARVQKLILTSSCSVVFQGKHIINGVETLPYAAVPLDDYVHTKILQEKEVLAANGKQLLTVAIRPHGIFGPRDAQTLPGIDEAGKAGKTRYMIGNGLNLVDFTYVENVAHAHVIAAEKLTTNSKIGGQAYNITNDEPIHFWAFVGRALELFGHEVPIGRLPYFPILLIAYIIQILSRMVSFIKPIEFALTPLKVTLAGTHHTYSCEKAKREIGYRPIVSMKEGLESSIKWFVQQNQEKSKDRPIIRSK